MHEQGRHTEENGSAINRDVQASWPLVAESSDQEARSNQWVLQSLNEPTAADASSSVDTADDEAPGNVVRIGHVLENGKYTCVLGTCARKTFNRPADLRRHHSTIHAIQRPQFWCTVSTCPRSAAAGGQAFRRRYRLHHHVRKMHSGGESSGGFGATQDADDDVPGFSAL